MGTLKVIELAWELAWSHQATNAGERIIVAGNSDGSDCTIPITTAGSNGYNEVILTLMAGTLSVIIELVIGIFAVTLVKFDVIRFGGFRLPVSKIGESWDDIDQCVIGELTVAWNLGVTGEYKVHQVPEDCPCVFRRASECDIAETPTNTSMENLCE
jgi:hypothetical protein